MIRGKCIILAEDLRTLSLLRRYAQHLFRLRDIEPGELPAGKGAADQFVRERYHKRVAECRRGKRACVLLVHMDADIRAVQQRHQWLDASLKEHEMEKRGSAEKIALVIPKRHTEAWLAWHAGHGTNEVDDIKSQKKLDYDSLIVSFAERLFTLTRNNADISDDLPDSLRRAIPELRRLEQGE